MRDLAPKIMLIVLFLGCNALKRTSEVDLGRAPLPQDQQAAAALFEERQGLIFSVPQPTIDTYIESIQETLNNQEWRDTTSEKPKTSPLGDGFQQEHSIEEVIGKLCIKKIKLDPQGDSTLSVKLSMLTCGISLEAKGIKASLRHTGALRNKPVTATIESLQLKEIRDSLTLTLEMSIEFDHDGVITIGKISPGDGFSQLVDPDHYIFNVSKSGFEQAAADLGTEVNDLRRRSIEALLKVVQSRMLASLEKNILKAGNKANERLTATSAKSAKANVSANFGALSFVGSIRPKGIVGVEGLHLATQLRYQAAFDESKKSLPCSSTWNEAPLPKTNWLADAAKKFPLPTTTQANAATGRAQAIVRLPFAVLNGLIWQGFGDGSHCKFEWKDDKGEGLTLEAGFKGQPSIEVVPSAAPAKSVLTLAFQIPDLELKLSPKLQSLLQQNATPAASANMKGFSFPITVRSIPNPSDPNSLSMSFEVAGQERYGKLSEFSYQALLEDLGTTEARNSMSVDLLYKTLTMSILSQYLGPYFEKNKFVVNLSNTSGLQLDEISGSTWGIEATLSMALPKSTSASLLESRVKDTKKQVIDGGKSLKNPSSLQLAETPGSLTDSLRAAGIPVLVGLKYQDANPDYWKRLMGWRCLGREDSLSMPLASQLFVFSDSQACTTNRGATQEFRWYFTGRPDKTSNFASIRSQHIRYIRQETIPPEQHLTLAKLTDKLGTPKKTTRSSDAATASWEQDGTTVIAEAFCRSQTICKEGELKDFLVVDLDVWGHQ